MVNPYGFCDKENYKEKRPQLVFEVHAVALVTIGVDLCALGVHESTVFLCNCWRGADSMNCVCFAGRAGRDKLAAR